MAYTLSELAAASPNYFVKGVMDMFVEETQLMRQLRFVGVEGLSASVAYTDDRGTAGFYGIGEEIVPTEIHPKALAHSILELVGEVEIPRLAKKGFAQADLVEMNTRNETRRMGEVFEYEMFYGSGVGQSLKGLHALANAGYMQEIHLAGASATPKACTLLDLNRAIQMMRGKAQLIVMSETTFLYFNALLQLKGSYQTTRDAFGVLCTEYQGLPVIHLPGLLETELCGASDGQYDAATGGSSSSIWVLNLRPSDGLFGIQNGSMGTEYFDKTERKVGEKVRMVWDCGIAVYPKWCGVRIDNVDVDGTWSVAGED